VNVYQRAKRGGDYVVMDNGIAEGIKFTGAELLAAASIFGANEIVLPDTLGDAKQTLSRVRTFLEHYSTPLAESGIEKMMAVAQGTALQSVKNTINAFADMPKVTCIGIPRHLIKTTGSTSIRIDVANWIASAHKDRFEIHLLGADAAARKEIRWAATYAPHIRSIDSSMPFNYALAGYALDTVGNIYRPGQYFDRAWGITANVDLVKHNIAVFRGWANGEQSGLEKASGSEVRGVSATGGERQVRTLPKPFNS